MCGICGIIDFSQKSVEEDLIRQMMKIQKHRGPDDEGVYLDQNIGLGFVSLSIIDLTPAGHQPMFSDSQKTVIVYNGEVYNFLELKSKYLSGIKFKSDTDTEVILYLYEKFGEKFVEKLEGDFALAIYDKRINSLYLYRDRLGVKPVYYYFNKSIL